MDRQIEAGHLISFIHFHVAEQMDDELSVCTALLHDVIEDTEITFEDLTGEFPEEIVEAYVVLQEIRI